MATLTVEELLSGAAATHRIELPPHLTGQAENAAPSEIVLRPLVLSDIARLNRAAGQNSDLAAALMVQQAMVDPVLTVEQVQRMPAGLVEFLVGEVNRVSGLSLHGDELDDAVHAPLARACFVLAREFGWSPDRCAELTLGQVLLYLEMLGRGEHPAS
jgi:hypothetical protein